MDNPKKIIQYHNDSIQQLKDELQQVKLKLETEILARHDAEFLLAERKKELICQNQISGILISANTDVEQVLKKILEIVPPAMQFNDIAEAQICVNGNIYKTKGYATSEYSIEQQIFIDGKLVGEIKICYPENKYKSGKEAFLTEEYDLIFNIAARISSFLTQIELQTKEAESTELYKLFMNASPDAIAITDITGKIEFVSPSVLRIFDFYKIEILIGRNILEFIDPSEQLKARSGIEDMFRGVFPGAIEYKGIKADGSHVWVEVSGEFIRNSKDEPEKMIFIIRDISQKRESAENLRKSEEMYRSLVESSDAAIFMIDSTGRYLYLNAVEAGRYGMVPDEMLGKNINDYLPTEQFQQMLIDIKKVMSENKGFAREVESEFKGAFHNFRITLQPVRDKNNQPFAVLFFINDITELIQTSQKIQKNEVRFRQLVETINDAIYEIGADATIKYVSPSIEKVVGFQPEELLGKSFFDFMYPDDRPMLINALQNLGTLNNPHLEYRYIAKDGGLRWVRSSTTPIIKDGKLIGGIGSLTDISERKLADEKLKTSEKQYRHLVESIHDVIFEFSPDGTLRYISPSLTKIAGFTPEELAGANFADFIHPNDRARVQKSMGQIIEKELSISDFRLFDKDKNIHWVRSSVSPVFENGIFAGGSGTVTDITAQKIAEEELIISEQRYRSVFENIQDTYYEATIDGILLEVSPSVKILSKGLYERADLLGMSLIDIYTDPTERERFFENILKNGKASDYELTLQNRDGSAIPVAINSTLVCDESGVPVRIIGNIRDISERKIAERALQESEKQLNTAQEIANMGSWQFMVKSGEVKWSENYYRLMGEKPGSTPLSLEEIKQRVHPSDRVLFENKIAKIDSNKTSGTFYFRLLMQNGEIKWIQSTVAPVFDGDELVEIDGISIDITEKKKSELQIEKQKDELQAIVTAIPDMIFILNDKGVYLEYFASETEKLGAPRELIIGHTIQEALGEKEASVHLGKINECIETQKTVEYEYSMTIDGDENYFEARLVPMPNRLILSFIRDISKRKQSEIAIKKLSQAVEQSPVSIVITNLNGNIEYANPKACETTGYSFEELRNQNPRVLKSGETSSSEYEFLWHSISHGNVWQGIFHNKRKNGELFWESSQITPITDEKGKIINYLAIKEDITDRKKTQEDLMRSESRFSQIAEQSQTVIWEVDKNGLYTFISKVSKVVWGYEPEELVGKKYFYDLHPTEGREEFKESALQIFAQKVVFKDLINSIVTASNKLIWVSTNATPIIDNDDNLIGYRGSDNDITNKKLAEEALKQSEEALNYAQQIANMGSWSLDLTNNKLTCSKNYFNIMGIPACSEMNSQIFFERVHPEDIHLVDEKLEEMNLFKKPVIYDIRLRMPDNEYGWIQNNIIPEFEDEILIRYKGVNIDVTEKKQAEENIRKQNERLSAIINAIPDLIFVSDREGTYLEYYNVSNQELLHPADQLIGLTVLDLFEEETAYLHIRKINECLQTKKLVSYDYSTSINGTIRYFEARLAPLGNDKVLRFIRDFTQEKQKDKEIKKLSLAVEQSPVIIVITDLAGDIEYVNPAFYETTGYELDEVLGKNTRILKSGETDPTVYVDMWKTIAAGDRWNGEWINKKKNGELYWENVSITPIRDDNGKVTNYMAITQDISQRKQSEQEIRDLNTNLEHKIEERTHQLAKTNENLLSEIEERKRIENALSESEKSYRTVVENVNEVIFLTDAEGLWVFLNKSWEVVTGFTVEESLGKHYTNFIHPLDLERNRELIEPLNNRKKDYYREETRYLTKEGGFRWIEVFARLQLNENDEITGSYGTLMDITERKLAEIALAIEKQRLANIIEGTNVGTWEWNIQTGETVFNERWAEILGYTLEELLPVSIETWLKLAHPDDLKISGELLEKHFKGELDYYSFESRMKHKTGDWVWVLDRGKVHTWDMDGKPLIMSGTHQDITDRKFADDFENQILQLSTKLAGVTTSEINSALKLALLRIGQFLNADRAYIFEFNMSNETMNNTHEWCNEGIQPEIQNLQNLPYNIFPNWLEIMQVHNNVIIPSVQDLPENRQRERELLEPQGIQSLVAIPLLIENNLIGFVGLDSVKSKRNYNSTEINILKVWSGMLSSLINNQRSGKLLEQTRQNYETFFNTIDDFLFIFDEQGNIVDTNNTVNVRLGYSNAELNNKSVLMVRPPERHEEALSVMQEILEGKAQYCSIPLITKSGEKIPVETRIKRGYWNGSPVIFGVSKDISQILMSEQKFASAFHLNTAVMAITRFDNDQFVDVNNAFVNTLGYSREDIKGKTLVTLGVVRENTEKGTIQDAINMGIALREIEIIAYSKTNELFIFLLSAEEIYVGLVRCVLSVAVNITERKTMENELRKAREDADRANMAKSEFLSRMSHELRTPMNSILGFAQLMEMGVLNDRQKSGVNHILRSGKYLLNMINEVLELSRIESGRLSLSIEPVDINAAINEILDFIKPQSEQKNISIHNYAMSDELFINADKQKVKQVLLNILGNAIKYNHKGGMVEIDVSAVKSDNNNEKYIRITVTDSGPGIAEENIGKIFNPFERIGAEKTVTEGTGLGLSVSKKLTEAMNGFIGVESTVGKGSRFWVEYPFIQKGEIKKEQIIPEKVISYVKTEIEGTILYFEDNESNIELIEEIIIENRPSVKFFAQKDGMRAVEFTTEIMPDLILLDLNLPGKQGDKILEEILNSPILKNIPVIMVSADAMPNQIRNLLKIGARNYLTKPINVSQLLKTIDQYLMKEIK